MDATTRKSAGNSTLNPGRASAAVQRAGTTIFWALIIAILVARVGFFQPDLFATLHGSPSSVAETK